jgi:hypothetical protein
MKAMADHATKKKAGAALRVVEERRTNIFPETSRGFRLPLFKMRAAPCENTLVD